MRSRRIMAFALLPFVCATASGQAANRKAADVAALFRDYDRPDAPGASVLVVKGGKVLYKRAFGMANLEERTPATIATNYRLASLTKQFTAMAVMLLAERGKLSYDSRLTDFSRTSRLTAGESPSAIF